MWFEQSNILRHCWFLKQQCSFYNEVNPVRLGGDELVVEIDESLFRYKQRYHASRQAAREMWIFGLVDKKPPNKMLSLHLVADRKESTLL